MASPYRVLLLRSAHPAWESFRNRLAELPSLHLIGTADDAAAALDLVAGSSPDIIVAGATIGGVSVLPLLVALRERSPASRFVVIVERLDEVAPTELLARHGLVLEAQLLWSKATAERFQRCVVTVTDDDSVTASRAIAEGFLERMRHGAEMPEPPPRLTATERAVLKGQVQGLTHEQIAQTTGLPLRSVERTITRLEDKFHVSASATLIAKASLLGLVPWEWVAESRQ